MTPRSLLHGHLVCTRDWSAVLPCTVCEAIAALLAAELERCHKAAWDACYLPKREDGTMWDQDAVDVLCLVRGQVDAAIRATPNTGC